MHLSEVLNPRNEMEFEFAQRYRLGARICYPPAHELFPQRGRFPGSSNSGGARIENPRSEELCRASASDATVPNPECQIGAWRLSEQEQPDRVASVGKWLASHKRAAEVLLCQ